MKMTKYALGLFFTVLLLSACGGGGGGGAPGSTPEKLSGEWSIAEVISDQACGGDGSTDNYSITVTQSGNNITVVAPAGTFSGTINATTLSWTGQYFVAADNIWVTITNMSLDVSGNGFSGTANWDVSETQDGPVVCSGSTQITGSKISNISPPDAPSDLNATTSSESTISLTWINNADDEQGFRIERSTSETDVYSEIGTTNAGITSFIDTGLAPDSAYEYRVQAYNDAGESDYSAVASAITHSQPLSVPIAPINLQVTLNSMTSITLAWDDVVDETEYQIERSASEFGGFSQIGTTTANILTFTNTALSEGTTYYYRVLAINSAGDSEPSMTLSVTTETSSIEVPSAPSSLSALAISSSSISISWGDVSNEIGYKVERSQDGVTFSQIGTIGVNESRSLAGLSVTPIHRYVDTGLSPSTRYYYRVRAYNAGGDSGYSNTTNATTDAPRVIAPSAPTNVKATAKPSSSIVLTWSDVPNAIGYRIERSTSEFSGFVSLFLNLRAGSRTYTLTGLNPGTKYFFRMQAFNSAGSSSYSTTVSATTTVEKTTTIFHPDLDHSILLNSEISSIANTPYWGAQLRVGCYYTGPLRSAVDCGWSMLWFDIDKIIDGKKVISARLTLYPELIAVDGPVGYQLEALASPWNSNTTYNSFSGWQTYNNFKVDFNSPLSTSRPIVLDATKIVQAWADNTFNNYGFMIKQKNISFLNFLADQQTDFLSTDTAGGPSWYPALEVTYE